MRNEIFVIENLKKYYYDIRIVNQRQVCMSEPKRSTGPCFKMALILFFALGCLHVQNIKDMINWPGQIKEAYAQQGVAYPWEVQKAIDQRKDRWEKIKSLESKGVIGENNKGYVQARNISKAGEARKDVPDLVKKENEDRQEVYRYVSQKSGVTLEETEKIFAKSTRADAPTGTPVEDAVGKWKVK